MPLPPDTLYHCIILLSSSCLSASAWPQRTPSVNNEIKIYQPTIGAKAPHPLFRQCGSVLVLAQETPNPLVFLCLSLSGLHRPFGVLGWLTYI